MEIKKIITIVVIFANIGLVKAQYTAIPDPCFEIILIQAGIDTEGMQDGQVLTNDIANVIGLDMQRSGSACDIIDPTGIEDFTNLEYLFIGRSINTIDLSNNLQLKEIYAFQGSLQNINITNCTELTRLEIYDNPLTSIDLSTNTKIKYLVLYQDQLTDLDVNTLTDLETLVCERNQITSINIINLPNLINIYLGFNLINNINLSNLPSLESLGVLENNITDLNLSNLINLKGLYCSNNNLTNLDVTSNIMLDNIRCANNSLNTLDLSQNPLLDFISVEDNLLTALDIRNNNNGVITTFDATNNPNLTCIFVDDVNYSTTNWLNIDENSTFVETEAECEALDINDFTLNNNLIVYPNPIKDILFIENSNSINIEFIKIYNMLGQQVLTKNDNFNQINLAALKPAMYLVSIKTKKGIINTKIVKK